MNPITFNDPLFIIRDRLKPKLFAELSMAPLLLWEEKTPENFDYIAGGAAFENGCPRIPFKVFRVSGHYQFLGPGWIKFKGWVRDAPEIKGLTVILLVTDCDDSFGHKDRKKLLKRMPIFVVGVQYGGVSSGKSQARFATAARFTRSAKTEKTSHEKQTHQENGGTPPVTKLKRAHASDTSRP